MNYRQDSIGSQEMWNGGSMSPNSQACKCSQTSQPPLMPVAKLSSNATVIPFLEKRTFTFSSLSGGAAATVVLCPAVCVRDYTRVKLAIRLHSMTMSAGQSLKIALYGTLPSEEDPGQDFDDPTEFTSVSFTSTTTAPALITTRASTDPDEFLKITLEATQTSAPTAFIAAISAVLLLRNG